jgi:hypothetical protein
MGCQQHLVKKNQRLRLMLLSHRLKWKHRRNLRLLLLQYKQLQLPPQLSQWKRPHQSQQRHLSRLRNRLMLLHLLNQQLLLHQRQLLRNQLHSNNKPVVQASKEGAEVQVAQEETGVVELLLHEVVAVEEVVVQIHLNAAVELPEVVVVAI